MGKYRPDEQELLDLSTEQYIMRTVVYAMVKRNTNFRYVILPIFLEFRFGWV